MALIYRSIFEVEEADFVEHAQGHAAEWLRWKLDQPELELTPGSSLLDEEHGIELRCMTGSDGDRGVLRVDLYENRENKGEQVASTFTAFNDGERSWSWMDVDRWTTRPDTTPWLSYAPSLVNTILGSSNCSRGPTKLQRTHKLLTAQEVPLLVASILEPTRIVPLVVVTYQRSEDGAAGAEARASELTRHLAGIGSVFVLGPGAVTPFSQLMLKEAGPFMDAHSGTVRVYEPGAGSERDYPRRHRYVPFHKLDGRRAELAARILAPTLLRRATEIAPPSIWRDQLRALVEPAAGDEYGDYQELFELASGELEEARAERGELADQLAEAELSNVELLASLGDLQRKLKYVRGKLAAHEGAEAFAEPEPSSFRPDFCSEVVDEARKQLDLVEIHESVDEHAAELDEHANGAWAQRAWSALQALQSYAEAKRDDGFKGNFKNFCSTSAGDVVLPTQWIGLHESEKVRGNQRFRDLRTLPISTQAVAEGRIYMDSHIRIQVGGTPCPRIHFYDDTNGNTGKIHIGWFGDHLDSFSKS